MHLLNKALYQVGLMVQKTRESVLIPLAFQRAYLRGARALKRDPRGFQLHWEEHYDAGTHPDNYIDHECGFASYHLHRTAAKRVLDVGSYRHFILGLLAHARVTTIDVRPRQPIHDNELVVTSDAKALALPDGAFDAIVSLCAIEHFGLGRYGDDFDLNADRTAFREMRRVLAPGGRIVFSTTITRVAPQLVFNAHRIYTLAMIHELCEGLVCEEERFFVHRLGALGHHDDVSSAPAVWDVYLGCWRKPE
jgi:SAM-dependent methyltransferase